MQERSTNGRDKKRAEEFQQKNLTQKRNTKNEYATADQEWTGRAVKLSFEPRSMTPVSKNHSGSRITYDSHSEFINGTVFTHTTFPITPLSPTSAPPHPPPYLPAHAQHQQYSPHTKNRKTITGKIATVDWNPVKGL